MKLERETRRRIVEELWRIDPAGIAIDRRHIPAEYDTVADAAYRWVVERKSAHGATEEISRVFRNDWGLPLSPDEAIAIERAMQQVIDWESTRITR
ncbi:MAG: hypothetical protein ABIQ01_04135 [Pseudolysinimonas sp.]